jgi:hypothetical protein
MFARVTRKPIDLSVSEGGDTHTSKVLLPGSDRRFNLEGSNPSSSKEAECRSNLGDIGAANV